MKSHQNFSFNTAPFQHKMRSANFFSLKTLLLFQSYFFPLLNLTYLSSPFLFTILILPHLLSLRLLSPHPPFISLYSSSSVHRTLSTPPVHVPSTNQCQHSPHPQQSWHSATKGSSDSNEAQCHTLVRSFLSIPFSLWKIWH